MKLLLLVSILLGASAASPLADQMAALEKRSDAHFKNGEPIDGQGKGGPILGTVAFLPIDLSLTLSVPLIST